jgi:CRISPR-associated protein Cas1
MIKRTLHFGNPVYLSTKNEQLMVSYPDKEQPDKTVAIEDIGVVVLEHKQITITNALLEKLNLAGTAVIHCNNQHLPIGLLLPLNGHTEQNERIRTQLEATVPLKKNLWQQNQTKNIEPSCDFAKARQSG